ncbi:MAG TPA: hypothetical protein PLX93_00835 [Bacilli bacterium]|nr:hypothetical protein [Bacilli bacterium]
MFAFLALLTSFNAGCSDEPSILSINPDNQQYQGSADIIGYDIGTSTSLIIIVVTAAMVISAGAFLIVSRRRKETM